MRAQKVPSIARPPAAVLTSRCKAGFRAAGWVIDPDTTPSRGALPSGDCRVLFPLPLRGQRRHCTGFPILCCHQQHLTPSDYAGFTLYLMWLRPVVAVFRQANDLHPEYARRRRAPKHVQRLATPCSPPFFAKCKVFYRQFCRWPENQILLRNWLCIRTVGAKRRSNVGHHRAVTMMNAQQR